MTLMNMENAEKIQLLSFDGIKELKVKCILTSHTGGETWVLSKQFGVVTMQPGNQFVGVDLEGLELITE